MITLFRTLSFIILSIGTLSLQAMPVAVEGTAVAEIILEGNTAPETQAATELATWIQRISGAELPTGTVAGTQPTKIYLGTPDTSPTIRQVTEQFYAEDLEKLKDNDGFAIRKKDDNLYIFASQPKGVLNAIYRLLDKNSDIIFVRAMESEEGFGTIYSKNPNLTLTVTDILEVPTFNRRSLQGDPIWGSRLMTHNRVFYPGNAKARALLDKTGTQYITHKHSVQPNEFKDKPEFFALFNGKRSSSQYYSQLCYTNPELAEVYLQRLKETATQMPDVSTFDSQHADNWRVCECPECTKPYQLADGTVIQPDDPAFRSTVFFDFTNKAALMLEEEFPGQNKQIQGLAYVWSNPPPKVKLSDNLIVFFAAFVRDQRQPIFHPINAKWHKSIEQWMKQHKNIEFFEYYFSSKLPWFYYPISDIIAEDLRYYANNGVKGGMYQDGPDITSTDSDKPLAGSTLTGGEFYDLSAIEFWVTSRLYWDPNQDVEALRDEFCRRAYREAAEPMRKFFAAIRDIWQKDPSPTYYSDDPVMAVRRYIVENNQQEPLRNLLAEAESKAQHPGSKALIQRAQRLFEKWLVEEHKLGPRITLDIPYAKESMADNLDFSSDAWKRAAVIDGFAPVGKPYDPAKSKTKVMLLHDRDHLYLAFECFDSPEKIAAIRALETGSNLDDWNAMSNNYIEMFFDGDQKSSGSYYQLAFGINGNRYDGQGYSSNWSKPWSVKTAVHDDAWRAVVTLPLDSIGVDINVDRLIGSMLLRSDGSSWQGGNVHQPAGFQTLRLLLE
jgi:hypothetical protein